MSHRVHLSIAFTRLPKSLGTSIVISEALIVLAGCAEEITQPATPRLTFLGIPRVTLWNPRFSTPGNPARKEAMHQKTLWAQTSSDIWQFSNVSTTGASTGHHSLTNSNIQKAFRFMLHIYFKRKLKRKFFFGGVKCYISWIMSHSSIRQSGKREIRKSSRWRSANSAAAASDFSMAWDPFFWPVKKMVVSYDGHIVKLSMSSVFSWEKFYNLQH